MDAAHKWGASFNIPTAMKESFLGPIRDVDAGRFAPGLFGSGDTQEITSFLTWAAGPPKWQNPLARLLAGLRFDIYPSNLAQLRDVEIKDVERVADDGITLYAVPRAATARRLIDAADTSARRRILGAAFDLILDDCEQVLDLCVSPTTITAVPFMRKAIAAARGGHTEAAQALAANILDTLMQNMFSRQERVALTSHKNGRPAELDDLEVRKGLVLIPIWRAYQPFFGHESAPAPSTFSRHATVHGVSGRQFTKRNTVQGIMLGTSLTAFNNGL